MHNGPFRLTGIPTFIDFLVCTAATRFGSKSPPSPSYLNPHLLSRQIRNAHDASDAVILQTQTKEQCI